MHKKMYLIKCSSFASFIPIPKALPLVVPSRCLASRCLAYGTQSVGKRSGGATLRVRFTSGLVPENNKT